MFVTLDGSGCLPLRDQVRKGVTTIRGNLHRHLIVLVGGGVGVIVGEPQL